MSRFREMRPLALAALLAGASVLAAGALLPAPTLATETRAAEATDGVTDGAFPELPTGLGLGRAASAEEIAGWDIDVRPDGLGLPEGRGTAREGEEVYIAQCAVCHGDFGEGAGRWPQLAGGAGTLASHDPSKTVGSYWPYASTLIDYINRAMPYGNAQSLTPDELYAVTAYVLWLNDVVLDEELELSHENFAEIELENQPNFFPDDRETAEAHFWREPCMEGCATGEAEIVMRARALDVTPEPGQGPTVD
ncbi:c-type cytochrome [Salinarimonas rosea]|uniref:c-type cytochrome n=1 Tax=Salinarimonas rosea TaxID=552063 RepID=UPI00048CB06C|nr:cytochrome c [Salinarimonas rosea]